MDICTIQKGIVTLVLTLSVLSVPSSALGGNAIGGTTHSETNRALSGVSVSIEDDRTVAAETLDPDAVYTLNVPEKYREVTLLFQKDGFLNSWDRDIDCTLSQQTRKPVILVAVSTLNSLGIEKLRTLLEEAQFALVFGRERKMGRLVTAAKDNLSLLAKYVQPDTEEKKLLIEDVKQMLLKFEQA